MKTTIARLESVCAAALKSAIDEVEQITHPAQKYIFAMDRYRQLNEQLVQIMLRQFNYNEQGGTQKKAIDEVIDSCLTRYREKYF